MATRLTAEEWRTRLDLQLTERLPRIDLYSRYYDGEHRLQFATSKFREAFGELFEAFATNWCGLVVDVAVERLQVQGFRFGEDDADKDAWGIWQANRLDAQSIIGHTEAVKAETAYLLVSPPRKAGEQPVITVEHPRQVFVEHDPADRSNRLAALKKYRDWNGDVISVVYEPDRITTFIREGSISQAPLQGLGVYVPGPEGPGYSQMSSIKNPLGVVPVIPLENNPNLLTGGTSDLKPAIALNDAANKFFSDMIHASEFTSFPQRVLTGVELPRDPISGDVVPDAQIRAAVSRLWAFEDPDAKVFDLAAGNLNNYVEGIDLAVQHLAAQTRTPPHYLLAKLANISADALKAAETGLVARCRRKHIDFSDSWEEAIRLAFSWRAIDRTALGDYGGAAADEQRAAMVEAETIWADPESRNPAAVSDSLVKKKAIGVPWQALMEEAGYSPQQIERMKNLRDAEMAALDKLMVNANSTLPDMANPDVNPNDLNAEQQIDKQSVNAKP
ncbi:Portal protein [uncultured Caudovirales phage]|uniref:Portal protein n=1 Tax=uncultured Caudovirales phage TaxID=2100421 RepID=A0A6J5RLR9_9CAUD|nr:Portal protein [uncultured Caudovirales phage]